MFDHYSIRSRQILFGTRIEAGRRGADVLGVGDLLIALILEDQKMMPRLMGVAADAGQVIFGQTEPHTPFFSPQLASDLLARLESLLPVSSPPVPDLSDMPISEDLKSVFAAAEEVKERLKHQRVEPLHLLAALLHANALPEAKELSDRGITEASVLARLEELT